MKHLLLCALLVMGCAQTTYSRVEQTEQEKALADCKWQVERANPVFKEPIMMRNIRQGGQVEACMNAKGWKAN